MLLQFETDLYELGCSECLEGAIFLQGPQALGRNVHDYVLVKLGNKYPPLLEVRLASHLTARVKLRCTRAVAVASADDGDLFSYGAFLRHTWASW